MSKLILIDGNNLAIRNAFANQDLTNANNVPTGVHYGTLNSLIKLKNMFVQDDFLIVWDSHSSRRIKESTIGVEQKIIPSVYKANRKKDEIPIPLKNFIEQSPYLKKGIEQTGIPQIRVEGFEGDDLIAAYAKQTSGQKVVVSSDGDFLQLLSDDTEIYDSMKDKSTTKQSFLDEYKIQPKQHIDVCALSGDTGDNIFGIYGVGETTALDLIQTHGTWENLYKYYHLTYGIIRQQFPDLIGDDFKKLESITTKSGKQKYPEITPQSPYTGVALAVEEKRIKNISKNILMALMFEERVKLAYSLKKMDDNIENLPDVVQGKLNEEKLLEYFDYYDIVSLKNAINVFK